MLSDQFQVGYQILRCIILDLGLGRGAARPPLIYQDDSVMAWVKKATIGGGRSCTWSTVKKNNGNAFLVAALFPIQTMHFVSSQEARLAALDNWIERRGVFLPYTARWLDGFKSRNYIYSVNAQLWLG